MKYIYLILVGLVISFAVPSLTKNQNNNIENNKEADTESTISSSLEQKAEPIKVEPEEAVIEEAPEFTSLSLADKIKANPNNCDLNTEIMYGDGTCADKPASAPVPSTDSPTVSSIPPNTSGGGDCSLVYNYSNWNQSVAYAVCMAESGGNTNATNLNDNHGKCRGSFGLMQLACFWIPNPKNASANMAKANEIYSRQGWSPWGAFTSGKYKRFL